MHGISDKHTNNKTVHNTLQRILHEARRIVMTAVTYGVFGSIHEMRTARLHEAGPRVMSHKLDQVRQ
jgi:hypothetical protein